MADAPPVVAQSADGVLHQFPAGTDMAVVDGVMKQYAVDNAPKEQPKPPEEQGLIEPGAIARGAAQGAVSGVGQTVTGVGAVTKGVGQAEKGQTSTDLDMMRAIDDGADFGKLMKAAPNDLARLAIREYQLGDSDQRQAMKQAAINKVAEPPGQIETTGEHLMKAGEGITGKETFPLTPAEEQRSDVKIAMMVGSMTKYIGAAAAGGMPAMAGMAGVDAYGETYNKAKTAGATDQDATIAGLGGLLTQGGLMTLPIGQFTKAFELVPAPLKSKMIQAVVDATGGKIKGGVASAIATGAEGAATLTAFSQLSTIADNVVAQNTYEPNRPTTQGVGENLGETAIAGAILPLAGRGANRLFRGRDQVPNPKPVLDAPTIDDAIAKADQVASGPVDVGEIARGAQEFGNEGEKQQAKLLQLFQGLNEGEIHPAPDGGFAWHQGDEQVPLKVWDEKAAKPAAEGETSGEPEGPPSTISPGLAKAQREHYQKLGIDVVYFENDPRIPFDGAVSPENPNTIFLSNDPQRNATQVAAHEVTHVLESTTLPDGTRLVDVLHGQIARGLTPAGLQHGIDVFGKGAPQREAFPEGQEGNAAHADAYMRHLIGEIGADIGGEAPKFQTFLPKIVNEVQARYGDDAAKSVVQKLIAGFQQAYRTLRAFFFKPEEMAEYGHPETQSQHWVTNLGEIHDTLAKMYAERFGTQAEKENAALVAMKDKAAQARLLKAPETPGTARGINVPAGPQGAEKAPEGQPKPETLSAAPAATPEAYEVSRQKAATYKRWIGELDRQGASDRDIGTVRKAYFAERQRMADILAAQPAEQVGAGEPRGQLPAPAAVTPAPRRPVTPENVFRPETYGAERGSAPIAPTAETAPAAPAAAPPGPSAAFAEKIRTEKERVWADKGIMGQTKRGIGRNEQFATDLARERVMREEAGPQIEEAVERGIPAEAMEAISRFYRPEEGETVKGAFDKAVDRWMTIEEAKAAHAFGDEDVATYDMLQKEGGTDPVLREAFDRLNEHYEGNAELPGDEDIPLGTGEAAAHEGAGEEAARGEVGRPGGEEAGAEPGRGGEVPPHEGEPLGPQFSPKEREERIDLSPGGGGKSAQFGNTTIDYGVARDGKSAEVILVKTPRDQRGEGSARRAMEQFLRETDAKGLTVFLSADPMDRGVSKGRLVDFYKSLGFVENRGRNKDFSSTAGMVREPQTGPRFSPRETPLLNAPEATADELAARQRQRDKEEAEARMRGRKGGKVPQESADETPLFGGPRQSTLFSPKQTETPEFKRWFEGSKVVDDEGRPLRAVHFTSSDITEFNHEAAAAGQRGEQGYTTPYGRDFVFPKTGFFFFVGDPPPSGPRADRAMPVYLALKNPLDLRERLSPEDTSKIISLLQEKIDRPRTAGEWGQKVRGEIIGGLRRARKEGIEPRQLWDLLRNNTYTERGKMWDEILQRLGKDGLLMDANSAGTSMLEPHRGHGDGKTYLAAVALEPDQIKSATANRGTFDATNPDIRMSPKSDEPFFSSLKRGVEALRIEKAPPGQWEATIRNMPGVKADERAWVGIEDWLRTQTKPVTKAEVLAYIDEHEVKVGEVQKGGEVPDEAVRALREYLFQKEGMRADEADAFVRRARNHDADTISEIEGLGSEAQALLEPFYKGGAPTKFGSYVLPGGKNYKELLLTLPVDHEARQVARLTGQDVAGAFHSSHWDEPNVLAHIRMDDRTGPNGEKVLHVAEIQSDWHQKGRKQGYAGNSENYKVGQDRDGSWHAADEGGGGEGGFATRAEAQAWADRENKIDPAAVPDAPFKTSWPELAMKRVLRYASENGYDRVSWDTGQTNADRYDLSRHVSKIHAEYNPAATGEGKYGIDVWDKSGDHVDGGHQMTPEGLVNAVGKEMADKIVADLDEKEGGRDYSGLDLKVSGEGMKAFYDKQLPVIANKIGKRFGAKVEDTAIPADKEGWHITPPTQTTSGKWMVKSSDYNSKGLQFDTEAEARKALDERAGTADAHSIPVTPAMRQGVMQGQPLFSPRLTDESRRKDRAYEDARPVYAALGRAPETQTIAQRWEKFKDQLGKRMLIATVDKYLATKSIDPMAYMAQRNFNSSSGALEVLLTKGTLKLNGSAFDFAQRNGGVETQVVRPLHGEHGDWAWWVAANRAERLSAEDREHLFTPEQIATLKKTNQGSLDFDYELPNGKTTRSREAAYMDTLRKYDDFNKNVMGLGVKAGLFKQDTVDKLWANPFYVPFFRVAEKEGAAPFTGGQLSGGFAKQYGFKTLTGGTGKLHNDLWQNVIGNWGHLIDAAGKNIGANQVLDAASLPSNGVARKVTQQEYDHKMTKADRESSTWTMVDGKKQYWHVNDPLLFDAISAIHAANFTDPFSKAANFFSRTLRMGVTSDPGFMLRVTIKDSEQAVATAPMSYNVLGNIVKGYQMTDLPGALANVARAAAGMHEQALRESDELISVMAGGGLMRLGAGHAEGFRRTTAESMSGADLTWADGFRYIKRAARQVKEVLAQSEDINRAALYSVLIKRGVPHDEATFAARDLEDFTLSGAAPWVRWIAHAVTFLNAGAQGLYKVGRSAADADRNVTAAVGGKVAWAASARVAKVMTATVLATLALDYIYRNDEDYKKRAEYDRNGKWWFKIGQYQFQIPMGFELAGLARIATNGLDMFFDKEMTGRRWANNALSIVGQNMFMNPTPTAIAPLVDVRTNTTGTGQPIEPKGMENLRPEQRYTSQDTLAARGLSAVGNKIARGIGGPTAEFSSPLQLDYLWNGYTGWLGSAVLGSADRVARQFTNEPVRPAQDLWNVATRGVVSKGPTPQSRYIDTMYQQAEAADKAYGTYEDLIKRQQFAKAQDFYKANAELINRRGLVDAVVRAETSLNQQIRLIQNNPNPKVTGEQKRLQIQQLQAIRNRTAESAFGAH